MKRFLGVLAVLCVSFQLSAQCGLFYDGFETGALLPVWQFGTGTYVRNVTSINQQVGTYAFEQTGSSGHTEGTYATFAAGQAGYISFWMKTNTTNAANGYVVIGDNNTAVNLGILFCYFNSASQLRFFNSTGQNFPIIADQWYHIEIQNIDWVNKTMDVYMDGVLILPTWAFRSNTSTFVDRIHLYNISASTASYDEIIIGSAPLVGSLTNTICAADSIVVNGTTYNASNLSGTEVFTNVGPNGCDSTVTINLTALPALTGNISSTICYGDSIVVNGTTYDASNLSGTEVFTNVGPNGCDSTVTINLTTLPALTGNVSSTICYGDSIVVNGTTYDATNPSGTEVFIGSNGCDSTVTVSLTITTIDATVTSSSPTLTANQTGAVYQWLDCDNSMSVISGATNQNYTATVNGDYAVMITQNGCAVTTACFAITGLGILENNFGHELFLYPNPTDGQFSVDLGNTYGSVTIAITDMLGKLIYTTNYSESQIIDLNLKAPAGVYFVRIESGAKTAVIRVVKE